MAPFVSRAKSTRIMWWTILLDGHWSDGGETLIYGEGNDEAHMFVHGTRLHQIIYWQFVHFLIQESHYSKTTDKETSTLLAKPISP